MRTEPWDEVSVLAWPPSTEERALVAELEALDRELDAAGDLHAFDDSDGEREAPLVDDAELIDAVLEHGPDPWSLPVLLGIDPASLLDPIDRVRYLQAMDLVSASVAAGQARALVAVAGSESSGDLRTERHVEHEVAIARRTTRGRAGRDIEVARGLAGEFRATAVALARGDIGLEHAAELVRGTRFVADPVRRAQVERLVLPGAGSMTVGQFGRAVAAAVCAVDAADEALRHARARGERQVWVRRGDNGLGELVLIDEWSRVSAMYERISAAARDLQRERRASWSGGDPATDWALDQEWRDRTLDNCRADVLTDLVLADTDDHDHDDHDDDDVERLDDTDDTDDHDDHDGDDGLDHDGPDDGDGVGHGNDHGNSHGDGLADGDRVGGDDGPGGRDRAADRVRHRSPGPPAGPPGRRRPVRRRGRPRLEGRLVIDLATLRGEAEHPCLLDGQPVPAQVGRRLARDIGHWRRMVTDPVDGHLLDFGRRVYLPDALRAFVLERDQVCRNPWCDQPAMRGELDHAIEYPDGPSDTANTGALCADCHRLKTARLAFLDNSAPDGSVIWRTAWGQTIRVGPRPVLPTGGSLAGVTDRNADIPRRPRPTPPPDPGDEPPF